MKLIGNILYIELKDWIAAGLREKRPSEVKTLGLDVMNVINDPDDKRAILIEFDSIKNTKFREAIEQTFGTDLYKQAKEQSQKKAVAKAVSAIDKLVDSMAIREDDVRFFQDVKDIKGKTKYTVADSRKLATSAALTRYCLTIKNNAQAKAAGFDSKKVLLGAVQSYINTYLIYPKIKNARRFNDYLEEFEVRGLDRLVNGRIANVNAEKMTNEMKLYVLDKYCSPLKPSFEKVTEMLNAWLIDNGFEDNQVESQTVKNYLNLPAQRRVWMFSRHGKSVFKDEWEDSAYRERASYAGAMFVLDGTTIQLLHNDYKNKGKLYFVWVIDAHSERIVGYNIGWTESGDVVEGALKNAMRNHMIKPFQLQYDGGKAMLAEPVKRLMDNMTRVHFACTPYNGKSKRIEQMTGRFEQQILRGFANFLGGNITSPSLNSKANKEYLIAIKHQLPALDKIPLQFELATQVWDHTKGKRDDMTPVERFNATADKAERLSEEALISLFMRKRKTPVTYTKSGLLIEINKVKSWYYVPDADDETSHEAFKRDWCNDKFDIHVDVSDPSMIYLYKGDHFVAAAVPKWQPKEAIADMQPGDMAKVSKFNTNRKDLYKEVAKQREEVRTEMEGMEVGEMGFMDMHKDALNRFENDALLIELGLKQPKTQTVGKYGKTADMSVIEE